MLNSVFCWFLFKRGTGDAVRVSLTEINQNVFLLLKGRENYKVKLKDFHIERG